MNKVKVSIIILLFIALIAGCSKEEPNPDELVDKLFSLNSNTSIINVLFGTVDNLEQPTTTSVLWGSKRNTDFDAVNGILNELETMDYTEKKPQVTKSFYALNFNGQLIEDKAYSFEIIMYVNPENYEIYLERIILDDNQPAIKYSRLYQPNEKIKHYIDEILEVK